MKDEGYPARTCALCERSILHCSVFGIRGLTAMRT
jgi:hypothetical protein